MLPDLRPVGLGGRAAVCAGDGQTGIEAGQFCGGAFGHAGGGAEEEDPPPLRGCPFTEAVDGVGAGYALVQAYTGQPRSPEHADTVGRTEIRCRQRLCEGGMAARRHDEFGVDGADLAGEGRGVRSEE